LACLLIVGANQATFRAVARIFPRPQRSETPGRSPGSKTNTLGPPNALGDYFAQFPGIRKYMTDTITFARQHGYVRVFLGLRAALDVLVYWSLVGVCQGIRNFRISQERERRAA